MKPMVRSLSLAALCVVVLVAVAARPGARAADGDGWVSLDISSAMNADVIQTPNEWLRCLQLYRQDALRGDEDGDLLGNTVEGRYTVGMVFGGHQMVSWSSTSYHLQGRYPHFAPGGVNKLRWVEKGPGQGLPPDGRIGRYRLHVDEAESPEWQMSTPADHRRGRNAIRLVHPRAATTVVVELSPSQQRRYRAVNVLFAAEVNYNSNCVRMTAVYADGTEARLYEGPLNDFHGPHIFDGDRREVARLPGGQREVVNYTPFATGYQTPGFRGPQFGRAVMSDFARPLPLDAGRRLKALRFETVQKNEAGQMVAGGYWYADIFAAIALPAGEGNPAK
jgi:hypothetical protein